MENKTIDWNEIEQKISIICYKFPNLAPWHEDLAQELRIHAYYVSSNYYDLYRKAIDFWRKVQSRQAPEVPYYDLEILDTKHTENEFLDQSELIVKLLRRELERTPYNKWDKDMLELSQKILDMILEDVNPKLQKNEVHTGDSSLNHYINGRINLSWVAEETGVGYKRLVVAMKFIEDTVRGLAAMKKIDLPLEYFKGYYDF